MRLSTQQIQSIVTALHSFTNNEPAELRLYGSRVRDDLKGGDIDLLLILKSKSAVERLSEKKHRILAEIKKYLGEQKIDLKIVHEKELETDPFLKEIFPNSVVLHNWGK